MMVNTEVASSSMVMSWSEYALLMVYVQIEAAGSWWIWWMQWMHFFWMVPWFILEWW